MAGETPGRAFAATWRNEKGDVVGTTFGGTMCWWPNKGWRVRLTRDDFEVIARCRECPGCLEFERRRLADRLYQKYGSGVAQNADATTSTGVLNAVGALHVRRQYYVVRIWAPLELHASIANRLHRSRGLELEPGMWRLGASSFAVLARQKNPLPGKLAAMGLKFRIEPLRLSRGRRAFRVLTAGLSVAREIYGEQRNRFYVRGLPPAERLKWAVRKVGKYQSYAQNTSPRAWAGQRVVLVPPEMWSMRRADRRSLRGLLTRAPDPEGVKRVMQLVGSVLSGALVRGNPVSSGSQEMRALAAQGADLERMAGVDRIRSKVEIGSLSGQVPLHVSAPPKAVRSKVHTAEEYQRVAGRIEARTDVPDPDPILTPSSKEGGYASSEHSQGELMPEALQRARVKEWAERRKARIIKESMEIIERMKRKSRGEV